MAGGGGSLECTSEAHILSLKAPSKPHSCFCETAEEDGEGIPAYRVRGRHGRRIVLEQRTSGVPGCDDGYYNGTWDDEEA